MSKVECNLAGHEDNLTNRYILAVRTLRAKGRGEDANNLIDKICGTEDSDGFNYPAPATDDEKAKEIIDEYAVFTDKGYTTDDWSIPESTRPKERKPVQRNTGVPPVADDPPIDEESLKRILRAERSDRFNLAKINPRFSEIANAAIKAEWDKADGTEDEEEATAHDESAQRMTNVYNAILDIRNRKMEQNARNHMICAHFKGSQPYSRYPQNIASEEYIDYDEMYAVLHDTYFPPTEKDITDD